MVTDASTTSIEQPITIDWEQLLKDLHEASPQNSMASVNCTVFDFDALGSTVPAEDLPGMSHVARPVVLRLIQGNSASTINAPLSAANDSPWDKLFSAAAAFETDA